MIFQFKTGPTHQLMGRFFYLQYLVICYSVRHQAHDSRSLKEGNAQAPAEVQSILVLGSKPRTENFSVVGLKI